MLLLFFYSFALVFSISIFDFGGHNGLYLICSYVPGPMKITDFIVELVKKKKSFSSTHGGCLKLLEKDCLNKNIYFIYLPCTLLIDKSWYSVNLSLEFHVVSTFWLEFDTSGTFSLFFVQSSLELERAAVKMHILWSRTGICSCKLFSKVSLMLDNPFPFS